MTGAPEVAMEDKHGAGNGPAEREVGVAFINTVGSEAVGTALQPLCDIFAKVRPEEAASDSQEGLVASKVSTSGVSMQDGEHIQTETGRDIY